MMRNIGVIGSGYTAQHHIEAILKLGSNVSGIASRPGSNTTFKLGQQFNIPRIYTSVELLANEIDSFDGLVVCIPTEAVTEVLDLVGNKSIPILIEKPAISHIDSLKKFKNSQIFIAYNRRFYETVKTFKETASTLEGFYQIQIVEDVINLKSQELINKIICNNSIHFFDLFHFLFGKYYIDQVSVMPGFSSFGVTIKSLKGDQIGVMHIYFGTPINSGITFYNKNCVLELKPLEKLLRYNHLKVIEPGEKNKIRLYTPIWLPETEKHLFYEDSTTKPGFYEQMKVFLNLKNHSGLPGELATIDDAEFAFNIANEICTKIERLLNDI